MKYAEDKIISRRVIEDVKKNSVTKATIDYFKKILEEETYNVLGCTEFSLLYSENCNLFNKYQIIDTEMITIEHLVNNLKI